MQPAEGKEAGSHLIKNEIEEEKFPTTKWLIIVQSKKNNVEIKTMQMVMQIKLIMTLKKVKLIGNDFIRIPLIDYKIMDIISGNILIMESNALFS